LEGAWYKAVMIYFRVFIWRYWGESQNLNQIRWCRV